MRRAIRIAACIICWGQAPSYAKYFDASGYVKELGSWSRSALDGRDYDQSLSRARVTLDAKAPYFKAHADYDHEVYAGSFFRTADYRLYGLGGSSGWLDMDQTISTSATALWKHLLYRGWVGLEMEKTSLRFGRQRIAWGTSKLWNPTDVLNPYQPAAVEREERPGVDAVYARHAFGEMTQGELVYTPHDDWSRSALTKRLKTNCRGVDASVMGGKVSGSTASWIAGGDFAVNLWEGSLHGEMSFTDPENRRPYARMSLGYEYTFSSEPRWRWLMDAAVLVEYYHNGNGRAHPGRYDLGSLLTGREVSLAKDYAGATFSKDLHPLLKLESVVIVNLNDSSHFISPSLQWNAWPDLYLTGGWQRFGSDRTTEYGRRPNLVFLQGQYFF